MSSTLHSERSRMEPDPRLQEPDPYLNSNEKITGDTRYRSKFEIEEWVYDDGYNSIEAEFFEIVPSGIVHEIGKLFIREGEDHARERLNEEIQTCIEVTVNEKLSTYVDGQMRLYAGYDVAENGDTLEEGDYSTWEDLRMVWEVGARDRLEDNGRYASI